MHPSKVGVPVCIIDRDDGEGHDARTLKKLELVSNVQRIFPGELKSIRAETKALFVRAAYFADLEEFVACLPDLSWIHVAIAGTEHLPKEFLKHKNIVLTNSSGVLDAAIGEFVVASVLMWSKALLESARNTPREVLAHRDVIANEELQVLVVGAGGLGSAAAQALRSVGVKRIEGVRRSKIAFSPTFDNMIRPQDLAKRVRDFNVVVASLPSTPETESLINAEVLEAMTHPSVFVNVGRGASVDHHALATMLGNHPESAAILDVTDPEPLPAGHRLWRLPNVAVSPHMAGDTGSRHENYARLFEENLSRFSRGEGLINRVL